MRATLAWVVVATLAAPAHAGHRPACTGPHARCLAELVVDDHGNRVATPAALAGAFTPALLQAAYGIDGSAMPPAGSAATIAVVDVFGYPNLESDLALYRSMFGLPPCTVASGCLTILNQDGSATPLPPENTTADGVAWEEETALDLDMASAVCPGCKLMALEANTDMDDGLEVCNDAAAKAGAIVISNSWTEPESGISDVATEEAHFTHSGVAIFAGTGDMGAMGADSGYPASSPHVIAVGGTTLVADANAPRGFDETAWNGGGSLCSTTFAQPPWQTGIVGGCAMRAIADTAAVADPATPLIEVFDGQLALIGGTSAATPLVAGIFTMTGHTSVLADFVYANAGEFTDVVAGANGSCAGSLCNAGPGWDGPTGVGTPSAPLLAGAKLPTMTLTPAGASNVAPGFTVAVTCTPMDNATVAEVDIGIDGVQLAALHAPPFAKSMPATLADGPHTVFAHCTTTARAVAGATAQVTQSSAPGSGGSGGSDAGSDGGGALHAGGGGCTAGGGAGVLASLGALLAVVRRRRPSPSPSPSASTILLGLLVVGAAASPTRADVRAACSGPENRCQALIVVEKDGSIRDAMPAGSANPVPGAYGPADLDAAYGISPTGVPPLGSAATIAVVDAFGYPNLEADLAMYRSTYGLPACSVASGCLTILNQNGSASPLPAENTTNDGIGWEVETALDLDMASAICPTCKLMAMEGDSDKGSGLDLCNDAAVAAGASVVSNSWSGLEADMATVNARNVHFDHPGTAIFGCTGDTGFAGASVGFPATSPHVIAVGGTTLNLDMTQPRGYSETAWNLAGSVCSSVFAIPGFQSGVATGCTTRAIGDVSAIADPNTGVAVYTQGQFMIIGGTSAATPIVASIFVMTGHTAVAPSYLYANPTFFNDVTSGSNGACGSQICNAGSGWDGPTGLGTPIAPLLAGALLPTLTVTPTDNAQVLPGFDIDATCMSNDSSTITQVDISLDGTQLNSANGGSLTVHVPATITDGQHTIFVRCAMSSLAVVGVTNTIVQSETAGSGSNGSGSDGGGHHGGGCTTTDDTPSPLALVAIAAVLSVAGGTRRARRRAARARRPRPRPAP